MRSTDELTAIFRGQGLRVTPQRQAIFRLLEGNESHPTVDALFEQVRTTMPTISLKTVYQTVHDLEALGEVRLLDLGTGSVRVDPNVEDDHQHLVCSGCGAVRDLGLDTARLELPGTGTDGFVVDAVQVIVRGRCEQCR
ncbi:MAG: Fur family transcriptional regulator [Actinomycetota bacterium]